ncbi:iron-containing alcohol dehydrogenase [Mitsuokella multacida]|uniref:iron-containing alcohol dehydrogenase n=1 Tax=Mitsuokella multacida TaxID=52226 RepID=UPI0026DAB308|nr:iron-containing alcohol dehydrogenase [Mitsuokella multacida]
MPGDIIPLIAIPTTAGTGSEVTAFSVITDHARNYKLTVFSYKLIPKYAILDADFLMTAPARVAAACGIDAMAEKALELIGGNIAVNPRATTKADVLALYQKAL